MICFQSIHTEQQTLKFKYSHIEAVNFTFLEEHGEVTEKKIQDFNEYLKFLKKNDIILSQD